MVFCFGWVVGVLVFVCVGWGFVVCQKVVKRGETGVYTAHRMTIL